MNNPLLSKLLTGLTYLLLLISLISTILLTCGCIPLTQGESSALKSFHAIHLSAPSRTSQDSLQIASFALCANTDKEIHCAKSGGKNKAEDLIPILYKSGGAADKQALDTALALQHEVFYGTAVLGAFFIFCALVCAVVAVFIGAAGPKRMKSIAAALAALGAAVMLVDGFSSTLVFAALKIASEPAVGGRGYVFESGIYWVVAQWVGFGGSVLAAGMLAFEARALGKAEG